MPLIQTVYNLWAAARCDRLVYWAGGNRLRILNYHGVCEDRFAGQGWVPPYFVARSAFESQLSYLRCHTDVLSLEDALVHLDRGKVPRRAVALTFDDGYANNLYLAQPLLQKYKIPATIFLATDYVESGELFHYDRAQLIRFHKANSSDGDSDPWFGYGTYPLDVVLQRLRPAWKITEPLVTPEQYDTLRPLRVEELRHFDTRFVHLAPHTHRHPILSKETNSLRDLEISTSVEKLRQWTGRPVNLFSYPNGDLGDFGEVDKQILRSLGIRAAFTTILGTNRPGEDLYELRRYGVGLDHSLSSFVAELTGLRAFLLSLAR